MSTIKKLFVQQTPNGWYYPKRIPKQRGTRAWTAYVCAFTITNLIICAILYQEDYKPLRVSGSLLLFGVLLTFCNELLKRLTFMMEEVQHLHSRYDGKWFDLLHNLFNFPIRAYVTLILSALAFLLIFQLDPILICLKANPGLIIPIGFSWLMLPLILNLEHGSLYQALAVAQKDGLNYGSGMAYSFFYGYLNILFQKTGGEEKDLKELLSTYEDTEKIRFPVPKLVILIPHSCFCHTSLKNEFSPTIEESSSLEEKLKTVAGVQNRVYKNSVYKIQSPVSRTKIYVCAEYATPLRTYREVFQHKGPHRDIYENMKNEVVLQFYLTLRSILENHPHYRDYCELIYYDDISPNGEYYDVGKIILTRLAQIHKRTHQKED